LVTYLLLTTWCWLSRLSTLAQCRVLRLLPAPVRNNLSQSTITYWVHSTLVWLQELCLCWSFRTGT